MYLTLDLNLAHELNNSILRSLYYKYGDKEFV